MRQRTFSSGFEKHSKRTRKERFLSEMDQVIPWRELTKALEPHPGHPVGRVSGEFLRVLEELGQVVERIDAVEFTGVDQAHEQVPHVGPVFGLVEVGILAVKNGLFECSFAYVIV